VAGKVPGMDETAGEDGSVEGRCRGTNRRITSIKARTVKYAMKFGRAMMAEAEGAVHSITGRFYSCVGVFVLWSERFA